MIGFRGPWPVTSTRHRATPFVNQRAVPLVLVNTVVNTLRAVRAAVVTTTAQVPRHRLAMLAGGIVMLAAVVLLVPVPTAVQLRDWATSAGPWVPLAFLAEHVVVTVLPFPRTAFTLAAGLLFGPLLGVLLAVLASTISAVVTLIGVRALGLRWTRLIAHPRIAAIDDRLRQRGWPAVISMRLIPAVPFSILNYAAGASAVRVGPYTLATLVGLLPGTAAVVVLGDALTGNVSPLLLLVSAVTACVGVLGLAYELRRHRGPARADRHENGPDGGRPEPDPDAAAEPVRTGG